MAISLVSSDSTGFADGNGGHLYTFPGGAPTAGQWDVLAVNSDTVVSSVTSSSGAAWILQTNFLSNQDSQLYTRQASGGEPATATITTAGNFNAALTTSRWDGVAAADVAVNAHVDASLGSTTPAVSTGTLAETGEAVIAVGALHGFGGTPPASPIWSAGYTGVQAVTQGSGAPGCANYMAYKLGAGTAAEAPNVSWTNDVLDRYILVVTLTASVPTDVDPDSLSVPISFGSPTIADGSLAVAPGSLDIPVSFGAPTATDSALAVAPDSLNVPVSFGNPDVNLSAATVSPDGLAIPVTFGNPTVGMLDTGGDQLLLPQAQNLLDCLCAVLDEVPNTPEICAFRAGADAIQDMGPFFDECCSGQAYVRIAGYGPTASPGVDFPSPSTDFAISGCGVMAWGLNLEIGIFRCLGDSPLSAADWLAITTQQMADAKSMRRAVCCWMNGTITDVPLDPFTVQIGNWEPQGPEGNCIGGILRVAVEIDNCSEC
jgi:hypothetical protein